MDPKELAKVVEACKKGSRKAKARLYKAYAPLLLGICLRYAGSKSEAEDILHEGFIKIYTKIEQTGKGSFEAWMKQVIKNEALQLIRKQVSKRNKHEKFEYESQYDAMEESDDLPLNGISAKKILEMIQSLPQGYRLVFNLFVFEEKGHKEIADILSISENTSKSQFHRARKQLQTQVKLYQEQNR